MSLDTPILSTKNINKYFVDPVKVQVLKDINIEVNRGEFVSIMGKSGCGKSTLLYILSTMDTDYEGRCSWAIDCSPDSMALNFPWCAMNTSVLFFSFTIYYPSSQCCRMS